MKPGFYVLFGDFNAVRFTSEQLGSQFSQLRATNFNNFIIDAGLFDIPMGGFNFTRVSKNGEKLKKLDRFLVLEEFMDIVLILTVMYL